jgi:hypothetical protein
VGRLDFTGRIVARTTSHLLSDQMTLDDFKCAVPDLSRSNNRSDSQTGKSKDATTLPLQFGL